MIGNIQMLRGLAALSVVFYHTDYRPPGGAHVDFMGVSLFFVISGFIMVHVTRDDASKFFAKRISRIVPLYWFATIFSLVWANFGFANPSYAWPIIAKAAISDWGALGAWFSVHAANLMNQETAWALLRSLLFLPTKETPILGVGWTLNLEMFFYLVFGLALMVSRRWAPLIAAGAMAGIIAASRKANCGAVCDNYGHDYLIFFIIGIAVYYAWRWLAGPIRRHPRKTIALSVMPLIAWPILCVIWTEPGLSHHYIPTIVLLSALCLHTAGLRLSGRMTMAFGASSYALYLMHPLVIETIRAAAPVASWLLPNTLSGMLLCLGVSTIVALLTHYWFEKPAMRLLSPRPSGAVGPRMHGAMPAVSQGA